MSNQFMKSPCEHCPFRRDVKPFLHPQRGAELAYHARHPYNTFACHKTTVSDEEFGGDGLTMVETEKSKHCAGFLTLQAVECGKVIHKGFQPAADLVYKSIQEMVRAYAGNKVRVKANIH